MKIILYLVLLFYPSTKKLNNNAIKLTTNLTYLSEDSLLIELLILNKGNKSYQIYLPEKDDFCASIILVEAVNDDNKTHRLYPCNGFYDIEYIGLDDFNSILLKEKARYSISFRVSIYDFLPNLIKGKSYNIHTELIFEKSIFQDAPESFPYGKISSDTVKFTY